ncbi:efflux RND transporter periplasmic adaptor subunit [Chitinophagaceae bacterium LWZ2-11]
MYRIANYYKVFVLSILFFACKPGEDKTAKAEDAPGDAKTPVTVTDVTHEPLTEYIDLNAVSSFLLKSYVKANANGYLQSMNTYIGKGVDKGQVLFTLKTKEAQSLGNTLSDLDSTFKFSGVNTIKSTEKGYITQLNHQSGDYVQDGEQLAVISDINSFVFLLDLPYELKPYLQNQHTVDLLLPDGTKIQGTIASAMPTVDQVSQTQSIIIKVNTAHTLPENLIAKVRIIKAAKNNVTSLPKAAVLTDETQSEFWIMKMIDSTTAVKVPIKKGLETKDRIEILSPALLPSDKILLTGNYGLGDTAKVVVEKKE